MSAILFPTPSFPPSLCPHFQPPYISSLLFFVEKSPHWETPKVQLSLKILSILFYSLGFIVPQFLSFFPSFCVHFRSFCVCRIMLNEIISLWHLIMISHFSLTGAAIALLTAVAQQKLLPDEMWLTFWHTVLTTILPSSCLFHIFCHPNSF